MTDYNGWTNWETWQVNLWSDNDQTTYRYKLRMQGEVHPEGTWQFSDGWSSKFVLDTSNHFVPWTATKA